MTGKLSKNFHGVGIGPLSNILAVKLVPFANGQWGKYGFQKKRYTIITNDVFLKNRNT